MNYIGFDLVLLKFIFIHCDLLLPIRFVRKSVELCLVLFKLSNTHYIQDKNNGIYSAFYGRHRLPEPRWFSGAKQSIWMLAFDAFDMKSITTYRFQVVTVILVVFGARKMLNLFGLSKKRVFK